MDREELIKFISNRQSEMAQDRRQFEERWAEVTEYLLPSRQLMIDNASYNKGAKAATVYDGTAIDALRIFADGIHSQMCGENFPWVSLICPDPEVWKSLDVRNWFHVAEDQLYNAYRRSGFYKSIGEYILDGGSIGTMSMGVEEVLGDERISFLTRHPMEIYIDENVWGEPDTVHRKYVMSARQAMQYFGEDTTDTDLIRISEEKPSSKHTFIHAIYPTTDVFPGQKTYKGKKYASFHYREGANDIAKDGGYNIMPYAVCRIMKNSAEVYGRSPGMDALQDILTLNQMSKQTVKRAQLEASPMWNIPSEAEGEEDIRPDGRFYYEDTGRTITPADMRGSFSLGKDVQMTKVDMIRKHFRVDFFLALTNIQRQMTATEIVGRQGEQALMITPIISRFTEEGIDKIVKKTLEIEMRAGRIPPPPGQVADIGIEYVSPLARAQRTGFKMLGVNSFVSTVMQIAGVNPDILDTIDMTKFSYFLADAFGNKADFMHTPEEVQKIREMKYSAQMADAMGSAGVTPQPQSRMSVQ